MIIPSKRLNRSIRPIYRTLTGTTTSGQRVTVMKLYSTFFKAPGMMYFNVLPMIFKVVFYYYLTLIILFNIIHSYLTHCAGL